MKTKFVLLLFVLLPFFLTTPHTTAAAQVRKIEYGMPVEETLTPKMPAHQWGFSGLRGDVVTIHMDALPQSSPDLLDTLLILGSPAGAELARASGSDEAGARIENFRLPDLGAYYIYVTTHSKEHSGRYRLSLNLVGREPIVTSEPVIPQLHGVDPDRGQVGYQLAMVLHGVGFSQIGSLQRVALGHLELPVLDFTFVHDEQVQVVVEIPLEAPTGEQEISFYFEEHGFDFPFFVSMEPGDEEPRDDEEPPAEPGDEGPPGEAPGDDEQPPVEPGDEGPPGEAPGDEEQPPAEPGDQETPGEEPADEERPPAEPESEDPPVEESGGEQPGIQAPATPVPTVLPTFVERVTVVAVIVEQPVPGPAGATPTPPATVEPTPTPQPTVAATAVEQIVIAPTTLEPQTTEPAPIDTPLATPEIEEAEAPATEIPLLYAAVLLAFSYGGTVVWRWFKAPANGAAVAEATPPVSPPSPPAAPPPRLRFKHDWSVGSVSLDTGGKSLTFNVDIRFRNGVARTVRRVEVHASSLIG